MKSSAQREQERLNNQIIENIDTALVSNRLHHFLLGVGFYKIYTSPSASMIVHTAGIMESLYRYSKTKRNIQAEVQAAFENIASIKTFYAAYATMSLIDYQITQERQGTAGFSLDCKKILNILSNNIKSNLDFYKEKGQLEDLNLENGLYPIIQEYDAKFENNSSQKIL